MNRFRLLAALALGAAAAGCRSARDAADAPPDAAVPEIVIEVPAGRVVRVSPEHRYAILRCESLPSEGEEARVYRGKQVTGRLVVNGPSRSLFVAADIVEGEPRPGDSVRWLRTQRAPASNQGSSP